jgi:hypothetical protein
MNQNTKQFGALLNTGTTVLLARFNNNIVNLVEFQVGADNNLLVKEHTHTFVNRGGVIGGRFNYPIHIHFLCSNSLMLSYLFVITSGVLYPSQSRKVQNFQCVEY